MNLKELIAKRDAILEQLEETRRRRSSLETNLNNCHNSILKMLEKTELEGNRKAIDQEIEQVKKIVSLYSTTPCVPE